MEMYVGCVAACKRGSCASTLYTSMRCKRPDEERALMRFRKDFVHTRSPVRTVQK